MRSLRRRLPPYEIEELVARYNRGEFAPALSRTFGVSRGGLRTLLLAEGVSFRGHAITPEDVEKAVRLYESGLTITQVVAQIGYSYGTIRKALHDHGTRMRLSSRGRRVASGE